MKAKILPILLCIVLPVAAAGDKKKEPPSMAGKPQTSSSSEKSQKAGGESAKGTPPGLAKKTGMPPGLAKKFGETPPGVAYVAFDPKETSRAWLLIDGKWKLEENFDRSLQSEVKAALALPAVKPPVPLPDVKVKLQVVKFE
jgi:hypothetical protein